MSQNSWHRPFRQDIRFFNATYEKVLQRMWNVSVLRQHVCVCVGVKICPDGGPTVQPWGPPVISHKPHAHAHNHHTHTTVARPNLRTGGTQGCLSVRHLGSTQGKDLEKMRTKEFSTMRTTALSGRRTTV